MIHYLYAQLLRPRLNHPNVHMYRSVPYWMVWVGNG